MLKRRMAGTRGELESLTLGGAKLGLVPVSKTLEKRLNGDQRRVH